MSERPLIGITSYAQPARWGAWELPAALVPLFYVESVERAGGRALDCFAYHGSFSLHLAGPAVTVLALDSSPGALERARANAELNRLANIEWREADVFEELRAMARGHERFDTIVLDPPAFAKTRSSVPDALRGYREINLRAMRCLAPGGNLITASCSFHVRLPDFLGMLALAAGDSGRRIRMRRILGAGEDHPEVLTVPETGYLKGALLEADEAKNFGIIDEVFDKRPDQGEDSGTHAGDVTPA